jgi:hypothetical protein
VSLPRLLAYYTTRTMRGSVGAGIGIGGTVFLLLLGIGIYFWVRRHQRHNAEQMLMRVDKHTRVNALELSTQEGDTYEMATRENAHELAVPPKTYEIGRSRMWKWDNGATSATNGSHELEGDVAWDEVDGDRVGQGFVKTDEVEQPANTPQL